MDLIKLHYYNYDNNKEQDILEDIFYIKRKSFDIINQCEKYKRIGILDNEELEITSLKEKELCNEIIGEGNRIFLLYDKLFDIFKDYNLDLKKEMEEINKLIKSIDHYIKLNITIKKSNREKVLTLIENINREIEYKEKKHISLNQVYNFVKTNDDIIRLAKAMKSDYEGMINGIVLFDKVRPTTAIKQIFTLISEDYNIQNMLNILKEKEIKITLNNSIPCKITNIENNKEYIKKEMCDALWEIVKDNI